MRKLVLVPVGLGFIALLIKAAVVQPPMPDYVLAEVSRGEVFHKVAAVGTVQPVVSVVVGSQVSGQVKQLLADHNDRVKQSQAIAVLDPELFSKVVEKARADIDVGKSTLQIAKDELATANAAVDRTISDRNKAASESKHYQVAIDLASHRLKRRSVLAQSSAASQSEVDDARAAYDTAVADLATASAQVAAQDARVQEARAQLIVAQSRVAHAEAQLRSSEAALHQAEADLDRTVIRAPMDGIVIDRSVTAGQTVAASFQAPTLFTIGDLREVNVELAIDEADIGSLRDGQSVSFKVDAYPDKAFTGRIVQIRKSPHKKDNVVTYVVVAAATNQDLLLLPGMTATAEITADGIPDALKVPSAALRYHPHGMAQQPSGSRVWVFDNNQIRPIAVQAGSSNNGETEILKGELSQGQKVVIGDVAEEHGLIHPAVARQTHTPDR
jgi:HlyD family secretion protein